MVRLKNIVINDGIASADFFPEDSDVGGHLVVDLGSRDIVALDNASGFGLTYSNHAALQLIRMARTNDHRTECVSIWY